MDTLAPLLLAFHTESLSSETRANIHRTLLSSLTDSACQAAAIRYVSDIVKDPRPINPFLLHHCLHIIETLVRTSFSTIPSSDRNALYSLLLKFLTHAHISHLSDCPASHCIPPHAVNKAAAALVALSKLMWLSELSDFPSSLLRLIDSPAHTIDSLASLLAGHAILTTLLDDVISPRHDLLTADSIRLRRLVGAHASHFLSALEVALRAAGPRFPQHVSPTAARAVATLVKLEPSVASPAAAMLARSVLNRYDQVAAQIFTSIADILSAPTVIDCSPVVDAVVTALDIIVTAPSNICMSSEVPPALFAVLEPLISSLVSEENMHALSAVLNGLMGVTMRWRTHKPHWLPRALDAWITTMDIFDEAEKGDHQLLLRVYDVVIKLCAESAFFTTNSNVLLQLGTHSVDNDIHEASSPLDWDAVAEKMADVAANPSGPATPALFFENAGDVDVVRDVDDVDEDGDTEGWDGCSANVYSSKCVEAISTVLRMGQACFADIVKLLVNVLSQSAPSMLTNGGFSPHDGQAEKVADVFTAFSLAYSLTGLLNVSTVEGRTLCEAVTAMLMSGGWKAGRAGVMGVRTAAALVPYIAEYGSASRSTSPVTLSEWAGNVLVALKQVGSTILEQATGSEQISTAGALLLLTLDDACPRLIFAEGPPVHIKMIVESASVGVSSLGIGALARWAVVPRRGCKGARIRWSDAEWNERETQFQHMSNTVFGSLSWAAGIGENVASSHGLAVAGRSTGLFRTLLLSVHGMHGRTADIIWRTVARNGTTHLVGIIRALASVLLKGGDNMDEDKRKTCAGVIAGCLNCIGTIATTCSMQVARDGKGFVREGISGAMAVVQNGTGGTTRAGHAVMRLIRDRVAFGENDFVIPGMELAIRTVRNSSDTEIIEVGMSLITESLRRHWLLFWPGDKATTKNTEENNESDPKNPMGTPVESACETSEELRRSYFEGLGAFISTITNKQLGISRCGLLSLQQLDASRRLYRREAAFRGVGAARVIMVECIRILGGGGDGSRESLADEAVEVLWGIASVNLEAFGAELPDIVRGICNDSGTSLDEAMVMKTISVFKGADNRMAFGRAVLAMANDMIYYGNLTPSL